MFRQTGGFYPGGFVNSVTNSNLGQFPLVGTNMQRTGIYMYEHPSDNYMTTDEENWIHDSEGPLKNPSVSTSAKNSISGKVWIETGAGDRANSATGPNDNSADPQAEGYTVVFSSLTKEGAAVYQNQINSLPESERSAAVKELLKAHPEYIAATVYGETDADGKYTLRFPDGTLNDNYLYGYVMNPNGEVVQTYSSYTTPQFRKPNANLSWTPQTAPAQNLVQNPMWYNVNFAVVPQTDLTLKIVDYNETDNPATKDVDEVHVDLIGSTTTPLPLKIEWTNGAGEVVKTVDNITSIEEAEKAATLVFAELQNAPKDGEVFTAKLYEADNVISADSFIYKDREPLQSEKYEPGYEDGSGKPGEDVTVEAPEFTDKDGNPTTAPDGTTFAPGENAPDGVKVDENTGEITVTIPEDAKPGDKITVPVEVTYPDGSKDTVEVTITVEEPEAPTPKQNEEYEPGYEDQLVVPGTPTESTPTITDKDGKVVDAPEGTKFKIDENFTVPEGYTVEIDETTGVITVTAPEELDGDTVEEFDVPVVVTYPDDSTDKTKANFKLDTDGDGTPDITDEDDDNDGVSDEKEKEDGTNPKSPEDSNLYEPDYEDGSGKPGEDVKVPAPIFKDKDGNPTTPPEGTKFTPGENTPGGVIVDENTGEITVTIPEDAKPGDKITVPVEVTYPDGTKDTVEVTVTVEKPDVVVDKPTINQPNAGDKQVTGTGTPGNTVIVTFPDGSTGQTIVDNNGNWTVNVPNGVELKPDDVITAVQVDKDGNVSDKVQVTVGKGTDGNASTPGAGKGTDGSKVTQGSQKVLPNTGEAQDNKGLIAGTAALFAGMGALVLGRRRKENEDK